MQVCVNESAERFRRITSTRATVQKRSERVFVERRSKPNSFPHKLPVWGEVTSARSAPPLPGLCVSPCGGPGGSPALREPAAVPRPFPRRALRAGCRLSPRSGFASGSFFAFRRGWLILLNKIPPSVCRVRLN